jgi:hypothetical protein
MYHCFAVLEKLLDINDFLTTIYAAIGLAQFWWRVSAA